MVALIVLFFLASFGLSAALRSHTARVQGGNKRRHATKLLSLGDPDGSVQSENYRKLQRFFREIDHIIYPNDPEIPGLTFATPVEWAPWMETIWFGNFYDYRTAFFHDVMYSNYKPCREGALLYKQSKQAIQMALLYQRYKKFDESSYSLPNVRRNEFSRIICISSPSFHLFLSCHFAITGDFL